ncbi:probable cytochrome P450 12d1 distal, mitochondrial [Gigantopelta aegis]|uniref:probable cytochrome P450 12d1 distal, mitochondrial n=1 Tax=Gigantopelta aegis TaxID=1735272 RepID=UPI001B88DC08|nr:probable cytochrome P450 12d1 distal, mitochondrial [Gigantopelta aegis]
MSFVLPSTMKLYMSITEEHADPWRRDVTMDDFSLMDRSVGTSNRTDGTYDVQFGDYCQKAMQRHLFLACRKYVVHVQTYGPQVSWTSMHTSVVASAATLLQQQNISYDNNYNNDKKRMLQQYARSIQSKPPSDPELPVNKPLLTFDMNISETPEVTRSEVSAEHRDVTEKSFDDIPGPRGIYTWPLIGTLLHFKPFTRYTLRNIHELYMELFERYGSLVRITFGRWMVLVEDPEDIGVIYQNEGRYPRRPTLDLLLVYCERNNQALGLASRRPTFDLLLVYCERNNQALGLASRRPAIDLLQVYYNHNNQTLGFGSREDEEWMKMRRPLNRKMLKPGSALKYLQVQNEVADDLVTRFRERQLNPAEIREEFFKYAIESISSLAFNKRMGYLTNEMEMSPQKRESVANLQYLFELFNEALHTGTGLYKYFRTPFYKKYEKVSNDVLSLTNSILNDCLLEVNKKDELGQVDGPDSTFIETMLANDDITLEDIKTVIVDLFVAGSDSTAKNLQLVLYSLAKNPEKQRHLYEEIVSVIGTSGPLTESALSEMQYLKACVKESFRFYNPISSICRFLPNEILLRGHRIPKDTMVVMCNHRIVKSEKYFHRPDQFLPERWLRNQDGRLTEAIHPMASLPFGFGPRSCVGRRFAEQEIFLAVTKIVQSFELGLQPGHEEINIHYTVFITTEDPIHFVFNKR